MDSDFFKLIVLLLIMGGIIILTIKLKKGGAQKRQAELSEYASQSGYQFKLEDSSDLIKSLPKTLMLNPETDSLRNIISGKKDGISFCIFDHNKSIHHHAGTGANKGAVISTMIVLQSPALKLFPFHIEPQYLGSSIEAWTANAIKLGHCEFDDKYWLIGSDYEALAKLFSKEKLTKLLDLANSASEGDGSYLIHFNKGKLINANDLDGQIDLAIRKYQLLAQ